MMFWHQQRVRNQGNRDLQPYFACRAHDTERRTRTSDQAVPAENPPEYSDRSSSPSSAHQMTASAPSPQTYRNEFGQIRRVFANELVTASERSRLLSQSEHQSNGSSGMFNESEFDSASDPERGPLPTYGACRQDMPPPYSGSASQVPLCARRGLLPSHFTQWAFRRCLVRHIAGESESDLEEQAPVLEQCIHIESLRPQTRTHRHDLECSRSLRVFVSPYSSESGDEGRWAASSRGHRYGTVIAAVSLMLIIVVVLCLWLSWR